MQPTETGGTLESSALGRLIGVLTSPGKTFRSIAERPTWAAPLLLLVLLTSGVGYLVAQRLDMEQAIRQRLAGRQELSQEQMDKAVAQGKKYGPIAALASGVVVTPIGYLLAAALFFTLFRLLGSEVDYVRSLAVWLHGLMPWAIATLLALPIVLSRAKLDPTTAQRGLLLSNLAALAPEGTRPGVLALLGSLDLFSVWTAILLVIGYRTVARVSTTAATAVVVGLWAVWVAGKVGLMAAFG